MARLHCDETSEKNHILKKIQKLDNIFTRNFCFKVMKAFVNKTAQWVFH